MTIDFDAILGVAQDILGSQAVYTPAQGEPFPLRAMRVEEDVISNFGVNTKIKSDAALFEVRQSLFSAPPRKDDKITVEGRDWRIKSFHVPDSDNLLWVLDCCPMGINQ